MHIIRPDQTDAAVRTLTEAFADDPLMKIVAPDERRRGTFAPWFMAKAVLWGQRWGEVWCNDDASAVAVWLTPGNTDASMSRMLRLGMGALPLKAGLKGTANFVKAMSATEKFHHAVKGPHWYLLAIGTRPALQGTGLGRALVEVGTARADAAGLPCYLETATEKNVAFYKNRGFDLTGQADVAGFTLYGMVRPQRAAQ